MQTQKSAWTETAHLLLLAVITQSSFIPIARYLSLSLADRDGRLTFIILYEAVLFMVAFVTRMDALRAGWAKSPPV